MPVPRADVAVQVRLQLPDAWGRCMIKHFRRQRALHVNVLEAVLSAHDMTEAPDTVQVGDQTYYLHVRTRSQGREPATYGHPKFVYLDSPPKGGTGW